MDDAEDLLKGVVEEFILGTRKDVAMTAVGHSAGEEKMCALACCHCHINLARIKELADNAEFICEFCGRLANEAKNLCGPLPLGSIQDHPR